jgi:hypothetical protein
MVLIPVLMLTLFQLVATVAMIMKKKNVGTAQDQDQIVVDKRTAQLSALVVQQLVLSFEILL